MTLREHVHIDGLFAAVFVDFDELDRLAKHYRVIKKGFVEGQSNRRNIHDREAGFHFAAFHVGLRAVLVERQYGRCLALDGGFLAGSEAEQRLFTIADVFCLG